MAIILHLLICSTALAGPHLKGYWVRHKYFCALSSCLPEILTILIHSNPKPLVGNCVLKPEAEVMMLTASLTLS